MAAPDIISEPSLAPLLGYYINLDSRPDRRQYFEQEIKAQPLFSHIQRFPALKHSNGAIGCTLSHGKVLHLLQEQAGEAPYVAVFEDDFCILNKDHLEQFFKAFADIQQSPDWNVITLTPRGKTHLPLTLPSMATAGFLRILQTQTMTGYIVKTTFLPILLRNMQEAAERLLRGSPVESTTCDQYWKRLQPTATFYYYKHIFAGQRPGWSDLEKSHVNYNRRFLDQNKH